MSKKKKITVIDGQGGSLGKVLVKKIKENYPNIEVIAIGTNSIATSSMLQSGADGIATGENPVIVAARDADIIIGPVGIVIADALHGEITPKMAVAVGQSKAHKIFIPISRCNLTIAGTSKLGLDILINDIIDSIKKII
ncbi:MAG: DUF3842 family protein [Pleomorphochaeta sp.]|nr:DUF3842 family protein [Sphaerochaetaceae bacterium]